MVWRQIGYATVLSILYVYESSQIQNYGDKKYFLVSEAFNLTKTIFNIGKTSYYGLKENALDTLDTFLDLVKTMNDVMASELRSAILKFYKIKYFRDFTNYIISMEEIMEITEHCLIDPVEKLVDLRNQFHGVIKNFEDIRNFDSVNKCYDQPDEVAVAHCILHQAVLFDEIMQGSLVTIVTLKTRQHAQDMNASIYNVQKCLNDFVPRFFEQLMVDTYTDSCQYLQVVNASINDLMKDKWKDVTHFPQKWKPLTELLKTKLKSPGAMLTEPLFATIFGTNASIADSRNSFLPLEGASV